MELLVAAFGALVLLVTVGLPLVTVARMMRFGRRLDEFARRLDDVDRRVREATGPSGARRAAPSAPSEGRAPAAPPETAPVAASDPGVLPDVSLGPDVEAGVQEGPGPREEAPPPATLPPIPAPLPSSATATGRSMTLEERIGARWLLYAAIAALVVGTSYFVKFAFDNEWITPAARVALGGVAGLALCEAGRRFAAREYAFYGQVLVGGGVVLLYVSAFAAFRYYALVSPAVAFGLFVAITTLSAAMADGLRAQPLAMFAVAGGFATPFLVGGDRQAHVALFSYDATLLAGTLVLARRHAWPLLTVVALALTCATVLAWFVVGYTRAVWLSTELFLTLFCVMFLYAWRQARRHRTGAARAAVAVLAVAPLLYHVASVAILSSHSLPLLIYLIAVSATGVIAAEILGLRWLRLVVLMAVFLPLVGWTGVRRTSAWLLPGGVTIGAVYGLQLLASLRAVQEDAPRLRDVEVLLLHANGLAFYFLLDPLLADRGLITTGWLAAVIGIGNAALAGLARRWSAEAASHFLALAFALFAAAIAFETSGPWTAAGWAAEGAAVSWIGLRVGRGWLRVGGLALLGLAVLRLADALALAAPAGQIAILNTRAGVALFVIALLYVTAWRHVRARRETGSRWAFEVGALIVVANAVTLLWVTAEIDAWFRPLAAGPAVAGPAAAGTSAHLARHVTTSIAWALHGVILVGAGIRRRYAPVRFIGMALLVVTIGKVFFLDLARLDVALRILSTIGLGLLLLVASYLYQRFQADAGRGRPAPDDAPVVRPE